MFVTHTIGLKKLRILSAFGGPKARSARSLSESWLDRKKVGNLCLSWQCKIGSLRLYRLRNLGQISHERGHLPVMMHLVSVNVVVRLGSAH